MRATIKAEFDQGQKIALEYVDVEQGDATRLGMQVIAFILSGLITKSAVSIEVLIRPSDSANGDH